MARNNTAVAKGKLVDGATPKIENVQVIYHQRPTLKSNLHFGSRLVFAKDGTLFVTQGERSILPGRMQAQDLKSGLGKIVRINTDGSIPKDNPFVGKKIQTRCRRSGLTATATCRARSCIRSTGELWELEHGPQGGDEINIARKGKDYGWPTITYGVEYGGAHTKIGEGAVEGRHGTADLLLGSGDRAGRAHLLQRGRCSRNGKAIRVRSGPQLELCRAPDDGWRES